MVDAPDFVCYVYYMMIRPYLRYNKELLTKIAQDSFSISEVITRLGKRWSGGLHSHIRNRLRDLEVDTSHFLGQGRNRGPDHKGGNKKRLAADILKLRHKGKRENAVRLRRALLEVGRPHVCASCGLTKLWNNKVIVLEINHKNGNNIDDREENLEFLCPNCHSQIPNHANIAQR